MTYHLLVGEEHLERRGEGVGVVQEEESSGTCVCTIKDDVLTPYDGEGPLVKNAGMRSDFDVSKIRVVSIPKDIFLTFCEMSVIGCCW